MSSEARRRAYLRALEIDVYTPRGPTEPADAVSIDEPTAVQPAPADWDGLRRAVAACTACALHRTRTQTVFGVGNRTADWMIVGEAPGQAVLLVRDGGQKQSIQVRGHPRGWMQLS